MNGKIKKLTDRCNKFFHGFYFGLLLIGLFTWACDHFYIGKSAEEIEAELTRSMFEVDSLFRTIEYMLDSNSIHKDEWIRNDGKLD